MTLDDRVRATQSAYDRIAKAYRVANSREIPGALSGMAQQMATRLGRQARLVDLGCGTGRDAAWFEAQGLRVTGVDLSIAMLEQARGAFAGALLQMDMCGLAFRDASFDGAWCAASLVHLPRQTAPVALGEIRRVVSRGGCLVLSVQEGAGEAWAGGYVDGVERFFTYYSQAEMAALLAEAGFWVHRVAADHTHRDWLSFLAWAG